MNRRSRSLLFWYVASAVVVSWVLWWRANQLALAAGISLEDAATNAPSLGGFLFLPHVRVIIAVVSGIVAAGVTAISVVGPVRRIEEWLLAWERGADVRALHVLRGDPYETMMRLLNELQAKSKRANGTTLPVSRVEPEAGPEA